LKFDVLFLIPFTLVQKSPNSLIRSIITPRANQTRINQKRKSKLKLGPINSFIIVFRVGEAPSTLLKALPRPLGESEVALLIKTSRRPRKKGTTKTMIVE
jgi:hypothetical protein